MKKQIYLYKRKHKYFDYDSLDKLVRKFENIETLPNSPGEEDYNSCPIKIQSYLIKDYSVVIEFLKIKRAYPSEVFIYGDNDKIEKFEKIIIKQYKTQLKK